MAEKNNRPKPFGKLMSYDNRALLVRSRAEADEVIDLLKKTHGITAEVNIETATFADGTREFQFFKIGDFPRVFIIELQNAAAGATHIKNLFDLVSFTKVPIIVYVHHLAITCFKIPTIKNFPSILLHDADEVQSYFSSGLFGDDEKEVLFDLSQKQVYVTEEVVSRTDYAKKKAAASKERKPRQPQTTAASKPRAEKPKAKQPVPEKPIVAAEPKYAQAVRKGIKKDSVPEHSNIKTPSPAVPEGPEKRGSRQVKSKTTGKNTNGQQSAPAQRWVMPEDDQAPAKSVTVAPIPTLEVGYGQPAAQLPPGFPPGLPQVDNNAWLLMAQLALSMSAQQKTH